jgi:hypothetical protein
MFVRFAFIILFSAINLSVFSQKDKEKKEKPVYVTPSSPDKFPIPPTNDNRLFFIQRSNHIDVIAYDVVMASPKVLDSKKPVKAYWYRFTQGGKYLELNAIERTLAYGPHASPIANEPGVYELHIGNYKKRKFKVSLDLATGKPIATTIVNGKTAIVSRIFVTIQDTGGLIPKVPAVAFYAKDPKTGADIYEQFKP